MSIHLPARIERRRTDSLRPSPRNPRRHDGAQLAAIAESMRRFGWTAPILIDAAGEIVAGEARWRAAQRIGLAEVPVVVLDGLDERAAAAYRVADNKLAERATWDEALLAEVLRDLDATSFEFDGLGFTDDELARLLASAPDPGGADPDAAPALPHDPVTQIGDLWLLGPHRLVCGDSTSAATLDRLFADAPADLIMTDPPYGMAYDGGRARRKPAAIVADLVVTDPPYGMSFGAGKAAGSTVKGATVKAHGMILGDDARGDRLVALIRDALANALRSARPGAAVYVCLTWRTWREFEAAIEAVGLEIAACIVWDKGSIGLGFQHYRPQHEFIMYCAGRRWCGGKTEGDVWTLSRGATGEYVHPTQKPVALLERAIANSSLPGDVVLDVFGGSGSTLIACERIGRAARVVELDPKFCDAIVRRWESFTGGTATKA